MYEYFAASADEAAAAMLTRVWQPPTYRDELDVTLFV